MKKVGYYNFFLNIKMNNKTTYYQKIEKSY